MNYKNNKPQINADERRCILATDYINTTHRKGCKDHKAMQQESLRPLRSLRLDFFSTPAHEHAPPQPAVHARLSREGMSMEGGRMAKIGEIAMVEVKIEEYLKEIMSK